MEKLFEALNSTFFMLLILGDFFFLQYMFVLSCNNIFFVPRHNGISFFCKFSFKKKISPDYYEGLRVLKAE